MRLFPHPSLADTKIGGDPLQLSGSQQQSGKSRAQRLVSLLALAVVLGSTAIHWPSENAQFTYDDRNFVERNHSIRSLDGALSVFFGPFPPEQPERGLYRPLTNLSYALDYAIWGASARGFHIGNALIHAGIVLLVYALAFAYLPKLPFAVGVALAFSLHPVHADAVDSVAGRSELLCLFFSLGSLLCFLRALHLERDPKPASWWLGASAACQLLACLSKETGAVLPAILAVHALVFTAWPSAASAKQRIALSLRRIAPHTIVLALYCLLRVASLGRFGPDHSVLGDSDLATRIHTIGSVFAEYARLLVYPSSLHVDYFYQHDPGIQSSASPQSLLGWSLLVALVACASALLARELRRRGRPDAGGLALCAFALLFGFFLPVSHLIDFGALLAERFVFAPSLGFVLLLAVPLWQLLQRSSVAFRAFAVVLAIGLALVGALRSRTRAEQWRDEVRLWTVEAATTPEDPRVFVNLGAAQLRRGNFEAARPPLARALQLDPGHASALNNLAYADLQTGRLAEAAAHYQETLASRPEDAVAWNGLGVIAAREQDPVRAAFHFERATQINPNYATALLNLQAARGARDEARRFLAAQRLESASSSDASLLLRIAQACRAAGDQGCAQRSAEGAEAHAAR